MADPQIVTTLRRKQAEIEQHVVDLSGRLAEARTDLAHVAATLRMFDPNPSLDKPAKGYQGATKVMGRSDLLTLCRGALAGSAEPLSTCALARYVIASEGWDREDKRLEISTVRRVSGLMSRYAKRGEIVCNGMRDRVTFWRLP